MTPLVRDLNARHNPDLMVAVSYSGGANQKLYDEGIIESLTGLHACEKETSLMLHIAPDTVHMERAVDCVPEVTRPYLNYGSIFRASPSGVWGEPTLATAEKGEKILNCMVDNAVEELNRAFAYMEKKEKFNYSWF